VKGSGSVDIEGYVDAAGHGVGVLGQVTFAVGRAEDRVKNPRSSTGVRIFVLRRDVDLWLVFDEVCAWKFGHFVLPQYVV
jgi:hypothetical protein